jgi:hypothetical protein
MKNSEFLAIRKKSKIFVSIELDTNKGQSKMTNSEFLN